MWLTQQYSIPTRGLVLEILPANPPGHAKGHAHQSVDATRHACAQKSILTCQKWQSRNAHGKTLKNWWLIIGFLYKFDE